MDLSEVPILYMMRADDGGYRATLRDGTVMTYEPPYSLSVILPTPEMTAKYERWEREDAERRSRAARPAKAIAMHRNDPSLTYKAIALAVKASPASVSKWIKEADGQPKKPVQRASVFTEAEMQAAKDQAMQEFMRRGGACTRSDIDARALEIARAMKRKS